MFENNSLLNYLQIELIIGENIIKSHLKRNINVNLLISTHARLTDHRKTIQNCSNSKTTKLCMFAFFNHFFSNIVQHLSVVRSHNDDDSVGKESFLLMAHYILRKPKDYISYWSKLTKSTDKLKKYFKSYSTTFSFSQSASIIISEYSVTSHSIQLTIEVSQSQTVNKRSNCSAILTGSALKRKKVNDRWTPLSLF